MPIKDKNAININDPEAGRSLQISPAQPVKENEQVDPSAKNETRKMITNGGGITGLGLVDQGSLSNNPLLDPSAVGTTIRIGGAIIGRKSFITYGDPNKTETGRAATGVEKTLTMFNPQGKGFEKASNWKENANREPYVDAQGIPTSKWFAGVKVIDSLTMTSPSYKTTDSQGNEVTVQGTEIEIQNLIMNVAQKKNIVRTRIAGRDGRVHQYINLDDYTVTCSGKIVQHEELPNLTKPFVQGERPEEAIRQFVEFMEAPVQLEIACDFLNIIGIDRAIVADFALKQTIGKLDNQDFQFKLWSDKPFEIFIEERQ